MKTMLILLLTIPSALASMENRSARPKYYYPGMYVNGSFMDKEEVFLFDIDENGVLSEKEKRISELWEKFNRDCDPVNRSWLKTWFDTNWNGKIDKVEKRDMVESLLRWEKLSNLRKNE